MSDRFVYVTYIRTTREKLWDALTKPEFTRAYFWGTSYESDWKAGSGWQMRSPDGRIKTSGEVLEIDRPRRLVLSWYNEYDPELKAEGYSRATFGLEQIGKAVKLTVTHEMARDDSKVIKAVSYGWPMVLASLKSLLETGEALEDPRKQS